MAAARRVEAVHAVDVRCAVITNASRLEKDRDSG